MRNGDLPSGQARDRLLALFGRAEIDLAPSLTLTAGARHDHHDRFGTEWSPRLTGTLAGRAQYLFDNLDRTVLKGLEVGGRVRLPMGLNGEANATWLSAVDGAGQRLKKRPRQLLALQLGWQQGPWRAGLRAEHHAGQLIASTVVGQAPLPLPDLTRLSAQLTRQFGRRWEATLGVDNLGQLNLAETSPLFSWAELPRTWRLSVRSRW